MKVRDNGIGIPADQRERVFDQFERLTTESYPGTGLGLAICKRIVERHGGTITVTDNPDGVGSCFEFTLPTNAETLTTATHEPRTSTPPEDESDPGRLGGVGQVVDDGHQVVGLLEGAALTDGAVAPRDHPFEAVLDEPAFAGAVERRADVLEQRREDLARRCELPASRGARGRHRCRTAPPSSRRR